MKLTPTEHDMVVRLVHKISRQRREDETNWNYWRGLQRILQLGIAVPDDAAPFAFPLNWVRVYVEALVERMDVRMVLRRGESAEDSELRADWEGSDMSAQLVTYVRDLCVLGRAVISVSARGEGQRPSLRVESPKNIAFEVDPVSQETLAALRMYADPETAQVTHLTLYLPDETVFIANRGGTWNAYRRTQHNLGRVPLTMATWRGDSDDPLSFETAISDLKPLVNMSGRVMLNLQVAMEAISTPLKVITGISDAEIIGEDGEDAGDDFLSRYIGAIWMLSNSDAKVTQLPAGELSNFLETISMLAEQASVVTGLPGRMLGRTTTMPPTEGSIRGDEARLVRTVELLTRSAGSGISWALSISERIRTGAWPEHGAIGCAWHNAATPTEAQRADALVKATGGRPWLSSRGAMHAMGRTQQEIDQELMWMDAEARGEYASIISKHDPDSDDEVDEEGMVGA